MGALLLMRVVLTRTVLVKEVRVKRLARRGRSQRSSLLWWTLKESFALMSVLEVELEELLEDSWRFVEVPRGQRSQIERVRHRAQWGAGSQGLPKTPFLALQST